MPSFCCIVNCGSTGLRDNVRFFRIPAILRYKHKSHLTELSTKRREKWLNAIKREDFPESKQKNASVCSKHFISGTPAELTDELNPDWVPTLNLGYDKQCSGTSSERYERNRKRKKPLDDHVEVPVVASEIQDIVEATSSVVSTGENSCNTQTDLTSEALTDIFLSLGVKTELEKKLEKLTLCCKSLQNNDKKTKYYTGLPTYAVFTIVLNLILPYLEVHPNTSLPADDQILLTLVKLRLNLHYTDLAYRFGISKFTASTYFKNN
ncbi:hypothetical protein FQR65_LT17613 [Abscondita terminalis]|nr:hypothetical protein FQR65_LT17613 [Abscondita terminalis]